MKEARFIVIGAGAAALLLAVLYAKKKIADAGGLAGAAGDVAAGLGTAAVDVANGAVTGVVTGVSDRIGIPTPGQTITDVSACQAYRDANGYFAASLKCSLSALLGTGGSNSTVSATGSTETPAPLDPNAPLDPYAVPGLF